MKRILSALLVLALLPVGALAAPPEPDAKSAVLMDVTTGTVLYELNADEALPPASVTKVMTMLLVMEAIDSGALSWDDPVTASENAAAKGGSQVYLKAGETMTVSDMLKAVAVSSANDCACALAEHLAGSEEAFVDRMNRRAAELGMGSTHFVNCTGLDDAPEAAEHRTSSMDIAIMSRELLLKHPDILRFTTIWMDTIRGGSFGLSNTNKLIRFYPGATGLKTGFTGGAMYCLSASARREELHLIAVVMGAPTSQARFNACRELLDYGFAGYSLYCPTLEDAPGVPVKLAATEAVALRLPPDSALLVEKGMASAVTTRLDLPEAVTAPVAEGQQLGSLLIYQGQTLLKTLPLTAAHPVPRLTWSQMFLRLLRQTAFGK